MTRKLTPGTEAWLREHIPYWSTMRDHAVAAGLINPEDPELTEAQIKAFERISNMRERVKARLAGGFNRGE